MNDKIFRLIVKFYPTDKISNNKVLAACWRLLFYLVRPSEPFEMHIKYYRLIADPKKNNLTRAVIRRGHWEPYQTEIFIDRLKNGDMIVDAGANFGHYTLVGAPIVGSDGLVIAFEPHTETFNKLLRNCDLLCTNNVKPVLGGLSDCDENIRLYLDGNNPGGHSFIESNVRQRTDSNEEVGVCSLDGFLNTHVPQRKLDILKIDVQGYEMKTLLGAQHSIKNFRPIVFCEVTPAALLQAGSKHSELTTWFNMLQYKASIIDSNLSELVSVSYGELNERLNQVENEYLDILFEPKP